MRLQALPLSVSQEKARYGSALRGTIVQEQVAGVICSVDAANGSCDVAASDGRFLSNIPLPGMAADPQGAGGSARIPRRNQPVVIQFGHGWPYIAAMLPVPTDDLADGRPSFDPTDGLSGTGDVDRVGSRPNYRARLPKLKAGDWMESGNQGQALGLLDGGIALLRGSTLAQVQAIGGSDTLKLVGRNTQLMTGFGEMEFGDSGGKAFFALRGGTDQISQVGAGARKWAFEALVGGLAGEGGATGLADLHVARTDGERVHSISLEVDGTARRTCLGNDVFRCGARQEASIAQGRSVIIDSGDDMLDVRNGDRYEMFAGSHNSDVLGSRYCRVGESRRDTIRNEWSVSVGRLASISVSGDPLQATPLTNALAVNVANGSVLFDIGNPLMMDVASAVSGFKVNTHLMGNIELLAKEFGMLMLDSKLAAGSVWIGASTESPNFEPAVLGLKFVEIITNILALFDSHVHQIPLPSVLIGGPTLQPLVPMTPIVSPNVPLSLSKKVMVGL